MKFSFSSQAVCSFVLAAVAFTQVQVADAQVTSGQNYRIFSGCDLNKVMGVSGSSMADNALIVLQTKDDSKTSQIFKFETYSSGYKITAQHSGKTLNIAHASMAANAPLEQYKFTAVPSEIFNVSTTSDGFIRLQNLNSGLYVNLVKALTADGTPFEQYTDSTACAEKFKLVAAASLPPVATRDPLKQPFSSTSIWNMPLGSGAIYKPANLSANPGNNIWATMPGMDEELIFLTPTAPLTAINYSHVGWSGGNRCVATGGLIVSVPMPSNYVIPNGNRNNSAVFLMPDSRTLVHAQPVTRCIAGGPATALLRFPSVDLYGEGHSGSHGGSGLSAIGGSIRKGELRPGQQGPKHALKVNVYAREALFRCSRRSDCYRWPATTSDSYAVGFYGTANNNINTDMKMGALLAIPPNVNINNLGLETEPAKQLAWTLQNYGAYIVDDTYAAGFAINIEAGPSGGKAAEFLSDYGFSFEKKVNDKTKSPWVRDMQRLVVALHVVANNSAASIGGGGVPRQPLAPPIAP